MLQEKYNPVDPRSALNSIASFQPLRSGALANRFCQPRGGFRLRRENRNEALSIDIDEGGHKSIKIAHGNPLLAPLRRSLLQQLANYITGAGNVSKNLCARLYERRVRSALRQEARPAHQTLSLKASRREVTRTGHVVRRSSNVGPTL